MAGLGRMSIPGFYYDEGRNRYFRLRPGEKPPKLAQTEKEVNRKEASAAKGDVASSTCSLHHCILQREYNGLVSGSRRLSHFSLDLWRFARMRWNGAPSHWKEGCCTQIATDGEGDIIAGIFEVFSSVSSWLRVFKVLRAPSGAVELHLLHQEELLGREASLYSTSTILPPQRLKLLFHCNQTKCLMLAPLSCSTLTVNRHGGDRIVGQPTSGYTIAKGHQQRLSRAPQCYAVTRTGQKSSDLMIAFGYDSHIEVYPSWTKHKNPPPRSACTSLCFTRDGDLISGFRSGRVSLRKHSQLFHSNSLPAYEFGVKGAGSSIVNLHALPHGNHVVTHSSNGQLSLWDWRLRRMVYCYATALDDWASQLERHHSVSALSPDGNVLAAVCSSGATTCKLWSTYTGELLASVPLSCAPPIHSRHTTRGATPTGSDVTVNSMSFVRRLGLEDSFPALIVGHSRGVLTVS